MIAEHFVLPNIDPVVHIGSLALQIGPLAVRWYALSYLLGIILGYIYAKTLLSRARLWQPAPPLSLDALEDLLLWLGLGIIVGGRVFYMLVYGQKELQENFWSLFTPWNGGMSFHGGFLGVVIAATLFVRKRGFNRQQVLNTGDLLATVAPISLFLGRLANFTNGELWGRVTDAPWGVVFCNDVIRAANRGNCPAGLLPRHPSQLYEAAMEGVFLCVVASLLVWVWRQYRRPGLIWGVFMAGYGLSRIALENVRVPDAQMPHFPLGLTMGMILSIPMVVAGFWLIYQAMKRPPSEASPVSEPVPEAEAVAEPVPKSETERIPKAVRARRKPRPKTP